jgi:hypothetical protein
VFLLIGIGLIVMLTIGDVLGGRGTETSGPPSAER